MQCINDNWFRSNVLLELLHLLGMNHVVISPGSRNAPLSHCALHHPKLTTTVHIDERGAGFFALGIAKGSQQPCGLICTSGTAAANYFPSLVEAYASDIPLFVLTADRPAKLQNVGAPQTIHQAHLYGRYTPLFIQVPEHMNDELESDQWIEHFLFQYQRFYPYYPIHWNVPLDEPLSPVVTYSAEEVQKKNHYVQNLCDRFQTRIASIHHNDLSVRGHLELPRVSNALIVTGPYSVQTKTEQDIFQKIVDTLNFPVVSDILSNAFGNSYGFHYGDLLFRTNFGKKLEVDCILWFGNYPTSKVFQALLKRSKWVIRISRSEKTVDPDHCVRIHFHCTYHQFYEFIHPQSLNMKTHALLHKLRQLDNKVEHGLQHDFDQLPVEAQVIHLLSSQIPKEINIFVGNSLIMRWMDWFFKRNASCQFYGNKGVNGIDGNIATLAGLAKATQKQTIGIIGDLAFCHDVNSLLLLSNLPIILFILNNSGGGIFHLLPSCRDMNEYDTLYSSAKQSFETLQGTPQIVSIEDLCKGFHIEYQTLDLSSHAFSSILNRSVSQPLVVELKTNRYDSYSQLKRIFQKLKTVDCL
ncbi:MAG: 2-succinyl-5-enolpyruvyl-6-hydroxy-3-cyclohexene-1-carboxylic-acid synthase [bacterium]|nr:2-succinyl-5-enolpyruvyl-6-hydroxy-3-cyclohexene-1-carboxylic-acid synthase [bacterium]